MRGYLETAQHIFATSLPTLHAHGECEYNEYDLHNFVMVCFYRGSRFKRLTYTTEMDLRDESPQMSLSEPKPEAAFIFFYGDKSFRRLLFGR